MEKLYDDSVDERVNGASLILQLARDPGNVETIICHGVCMCV